MAEVVQQNLEEMAIEANLLEETELFEKKETKRIMMKRRQFEYKLHRRNKEQRDLIDYIKYESNLLSLIAIRRQQKAHVKKKEEIEGSIANRILKLFAIACKHWPSDSAVWLSRIQFVQCRMKNASYASKLYRKMLRVISGKPNLWVMAAAFEFETTKLIDSARHILQQGIAAIKNSALLWQEYFKLELLYVDTIHRTKAATPSKTTGKHLPWMRDNQVVSDQVKEGQIALTVYKFARKAIPDNIQMALNMVDTVHKLPWATEVENSIFIELFETYSTNALIYQTKCTLVIQDLDAQDEDFEKEFSETEMFCNKLLKKLIKLNQSEEAWSTVLLVQYLLSQKSTQPGSLQNLINMFEQIFNEGRLPTEWALKWVELVRSSKHTETQISDLYNKLLKKYNESDIIWLDYIQHSDSNKLSVFDRACKNIPVQKSVSLWKYILELIETNQNLNKNEILHVYETGILTVSDIALLVKTSYLNWSIKSQSLKQTRTLYNRLSKTAPLPEDFFKIYIQLEKNQERVDHERLRKVYSRYTEVYGTTSVDAWIEYIRLEQSHGDGLRSGVLYSQAVKTLHGRYMSEFMKQQIQTTN